MGVTLLLLEVFAVVRNCGYGKQPWYHTIMWITDKVFGWGALLALTYCYLPGLAITYVQLLRRMPSLLLWPWVQRWMEARKQFGLLALLCCLLHLVISAFLWMPSYYAKLWQPTLTLTQVPTLGGSSKESRVMALDQFGLVDEVTAAAATTATPPHIKAAFRMVRAITLRSRLNWQGEAAMLVGIFAGEEAQPGLFHVLYVEGGHRHKQSIPAINDAESARSLG